MEAEKLNGINKCLEFGCKTVFSVNSPFCVLFLVSQGSRIERNLNSNHHFIRISAELVKLICLWATCFRIKFNYIDHFAWQFVCFKFHSNWDSFFLSRMTSDFLHVSYLSFIKDRIYKIFRTMRMKKIPILIM